MVCPLAASGSPPTFSCTAKASSPLKKELPWLVSFGVVQRGPRPWVDMFLVSGSVADYYATLLTLRIFLQPLTGALLLIYGWKTLKSVGPLPSWTIFVPGLLIVPIAYDHHLRLDDLCHPFADRNPGRYLVTLSALSPG